MVVGHGIEWGVVIEEPPSVYITKYSTATKNFHYSVKPLVTRAS